MGNFMGKHVFVTGQVNKSKNWTNLLVVIPDVIIPQQGLPLGVLTLVEVAYPQAVFGAVVRQHAARDVLQWLGTGSPVMGIRFPCDWLPVPP